MLGDLLEPAAKRVLALLPVLLGVSLLVFALTAVGLGDPARAMLGQRADPELVQQIRRDYALDRPVHVRYATWMSRLIRRFRTTTDTPAANPQSVNSMAGIEAAYADIKNLTIPLPSF